MESTLQKSLAVALGGSKHVFDVAVLHKREYFVARHIPVRRVEEFDLDRTRVPGPSIAEWMRRSSITPSPIMARDITGSGLGSGQSSMWNPTIRPAARDLGVQLRVPPDVVGVYRPGRLGAIQTVQQIVCLAQGDEHRALGPSAGCNGSTASFTPHSSA